MTHRTLVAFGACAFAGFALLGFGRSINTWRHKNLDFDFPVERLDSLFV